MYALVLAPTVKVVKLAVNPLFVARWMLNPPSLTELSVQVKLIKPEPAEPVKAEGADGTVTVPLEVTLEVLETLESPVALKAVTR